MKKKSNLILLSLIILAVIMGVMVSSMNQVYAENNPKGECGVYYMNKNYIENIVVEARGKTAIIKNRTKADLYYTTRGYEEKKLIRAGEITNIHLLSGTEEISFYLTKTDSVCTDFDITKPIGNITVNEGAKENLLYHDNLCVNYRKKWSNNKTMKNAVPYCFSEFVEQQYSYQQLKKIIDSAENAYSQANREPTIKPNQNTNVADVKAAKNLTCDAFSTNNYETMREYSHVESKTENNCKVTCREEVEVNFSDPIATQAGMCFEYLIEIKSKVVCESTYTAPLPSAKPVCVPYVVCKAGNYEGDAGGPNEEFDSCVNSCDNGKYTQKCIDKCYKKVYETPNNSKKQNTTKKSTAKTLTLQSDKQSFLEAAKTAYTTDSKGCITASSVNYYDDNEITALYNQQQLRVGGSYTTNASGEVIWQKNDTGCNTDIAHYYFKDIETTKKTVGMLQGIVKYSDNTAYYEPDAGILRAVYTNNAVCSDTCSWVNNCDSNTSLTNTYTFNGQTYLTYEEAMAAYNAAKATCESKTATCNNETTEYKMVVENLDENDDRNDEDKEDFTETFTANQKLNSKEINGKFKSMVIYAGGTCELNKGTCEAKDQVATNPSPTNCWNYHNIITFPGTWINNKTGQLVHSIQKGKEDYFTYIGNEYCTKLDSQSVNKAWYNWKVNHSNELTKEKIEEDIEYNITGDIKNYGYFGWNFDIKCFYGLIKNPEECTTSKCDVSKKSDTKDNNGVNDYKFRAISLDNMFPSDEKGQVSRQAGFNWNCNGTNLENENYIVEPEALTNEIEKLGDSIYNDDKYLDYRIHLTPETMRKIRTEYNDTYENYEYTNTTGNVGNQKTAGITVYKSQMLTNLGSSVVKKRGLIGCNNETNGQCDKTVSTNNSCYNLYQAESTILKGGN